IYDKEFPEMAKKHPGLAEKVFLYLKYKKDFKPVNDDYINEWFEARDVLGDVFKMSLSRLINKNLDNLNWTEIYNIMKRELEMPYFEPYARFFLKKHHLNNFMLRKMLSKLAMVFFSYKYSLRMNESYGTSRLRYVGMHDPGVKILAITFLVIFAIDKEDNIDKSMLDVANKELRDVYISKHAGNWEDIKKNYLFAQRTYFLMRFV
ncbi:hypothetical protein J4231_02045, partial [Candidatus Woesearchaeota archaeon]|nr:hypothetical protein [Candidatus Woesearchaeota archaeon]